jgi:hypothetical protein
MEDNAIYGVTKERHYIKYSVRFRDKWWYYTVDYYNKTTSVCLGNSSHNNITLNCIIPLNETNLIKSMERFEKLLLLK